MEHPEQDHSEEAGHTPEQGSWHDPVVASEHQLSETASLTGDEGRLVARNLTALVLGMDPVAPLSGAYSVSRDGVVQLRVDHETFDKLPGHSSSQ
jgi:hypothetical protein